MNTGLGERAYTIVEAMIFLAVSSFFFVMVAVTMSGQQANTEFTQAVRDLESRLLDIANDVQTGYLPRSQGFRCESQPSDTYPTVSATPAADVGTNNGCIIVGQAVRFRPGASTFDVVPLAGKQRTASPYPREVEKLAEAAPVAIAPGTGPTWSSVPNLAYEVTADYGLVVTGVAYDTGAGLTPAAGLIFATTFGSYEATFNNLNSGSNQSSVLPMPFNGAVNTWSTLSGMADNIRTSPWDSAIVNPQNGVRICLVNSVGGSRNAYIRIGGNGRALSSEAIFDNGGC